MSNRRDRVGRAIYEENGGGGIEGWGALTEDRKEPWRRDADRAISAMNILDLGFCSFVDRNFEIIVRNPVSGDEVTLYGRLLDDQNLEKIDKVLPTCVLVAAAPI